MERKKIVTLVLVVVVFISVVFLLQWRAANVVLNLEEGNYEVGSELSGVLTVTIEPEDSVDANTGVFIALIDSKDNVLVTKTLTLREFIENSDNVIEPVLMDGDYYYEAPGEYNVQTEKIIEWNFNENGEYNLFFSVFKLDLMARKKIIVQ